MLLVAAFTVDLDQSIALKTQKLVHAVARPVRPFFDRDFIVETVFIQHFAVAEKVTAQGFAAFVSDFTSGVIRLTSPLSQRQVEEACTHKGANTSRAIIRCFIG